MFLGIVRAGPRDMETRVHDSDESGGSRLGYSTCVGVGVWMRVSACKFSIMAMHPERQR